MLSVDDEYMFTVQQSVKNTSGAPVKLFPWSRVRRDYTPQTSGYYILFEGMLGVVDNTLQETTYASAKSEARKEEIRQCLYGWLVAAAGPASPTSTG